MHIRINSPTAYIKSNPRYLPAKECPAFTNLLEKESIHCCNHVNKG
jgi:hypothetical protein